MLAVGNGFGGHRVKIIGPAGDDARRSHILRLRSNGSLGLNFPHGGLPNRELGIVKLLKTCHKCDSFLFQTDIMARSKSTMPAP